MPEPSYDRWLESQRIARDPAEQPCDACGEYSGSCECEDCVECDARTEYTFNGMCWDCYLAKQEKTNG